MILKARSADCTPSRRAKGKIFSLLVENVWEYLRANKLSNSVFDTYETIVDRCCTAWNWLTETPDRIQSIATTPWTKTVKA